MKYKPYIPPLLESDIADLERETALMFKRRRSGRLKPRRCPQCRRVWVNLVVTIVMMLMASGFIALIVLAIPYIH